MNTNFENSEGLQWFDDKLDEVTSTSLPTLGVEEGTEIGILVIIIAAALVTITLLFLIAIFIDCRQQKTINVEATSDSGRIFRMKLPKISRKLREDEKQFSNRMQIPDGTDPANIV
ncbi:PREDICTED: uncharacterized protein LOC108564477 [Nicrophorus vespilloides]|uniref:Uncharacterized protein LOC108564477 n=1 Tax=Nicrophorus vespilloides TaxID=110193 RepID=A0ABM1MWS7_NICVS|nr:PREDICTED: uncharacterized protein LOC108564477 [Nicrophorus vespilloides]